MQWLHAVEHGHLHQSPTKGVGLEDRLIEGRIIGHSSEAEACTSAIRCKE